MSVAFFGSVRFINHGIIGPHFFVQLTDTNITEMPIDCQYYPSLCHHFRHSAIFFPFHVLAYVLRPAMRYTAQKCAVCGITRDMVNTI